MKTKELIDSREVARLVRAHGGILGAIEYGVHSESIADEEMATAWCTIEAQYRTLRPGLSIVGRMLRAAAPR
jgi:hypothetical protein